MSSLSDVVTPTLWCLGLSSEDEACVRACAGRAWRVESRDPAALRDPERLEVEAPALVWATPVAWREGGIHPGRGTGREPLAASAVEARPEPAIPAVLVFGPEASAGDLDAFVRADAAYTLRSPLTPEGVSRMLARTREVCRVHQDMDCMVREILLHRELLDRKEALLGSLLSAAEGLNRSSSVPDVLASLRESLKGILPLVQMHAVLWQPGRGVSRAALYYDGHGPKSPLASAWRELLLDAAHRVSGSEKTASHELQLFEGGERGPDSGYTLLLPLRCGQEAVGALLFLLHRQAACSREQNQALGVILSRAAALLRQMRQPETR